MSNVKLTLAIGLALTAVALVVTLTRSPVVVLRVNGTSEFSELVKTARSVAVCQGREAVPAGTTAVRLALDAEIGPTVAVSIVNGNSVISRGSRGSGWGGTVVTVAVREVPHTLSNAVVCFKLGALLEPVSFLGHTDNGVPALVLGTHVRVPGRIAMEYVHSDSSSWLSLIPSVARRMGLGHAWPGTGIVFVLLAALAGSLFLLTRVTLRELR